LDENNKGYLTLNDFKKWWKFLRRKSGMEKVVYFSLCKMGLINNSILG